MPPFLTSLRSLLSSVTSYTFTLRELLGNASGVFTGNQLRPTQALPATPYRTPEGVAVWRDAAENVATALQSFAKDYAEAHRLDHEDIAAAKLLAHAYSVGLGVLKDLEASPGEIVQLSSHTLDALARFTIDTAAFLYDLRTQDAGAAAKYFEYAAGILDIVAAINTAIRTGVIDTATLAKAGSGLVGIVTPLLENRYSQALQQAQAGKTQLLQSRVWKVEQQIQAKQRQLGIDPGNGTLRRQLGRDIHGLENNLATANRQLAQHRAALQTAQRHFANRLLMLEGIPDLVAAIVLHRRTGHLTIEVWDAYSDATIMLAASFLAIVIARGSPYTPALRDSAVAALELIRDVGLRGLLNQLYLGFARPDRAVLAQYAAYVTRQRHDGHTFVSLSEYLHGLDLRSLGLSAARVAHLEAQYAQLQPVTRPSDSVASNLTVTPHAPAIAGQRRWDTLIPVRDPTSLLFGGGRRGPPAAFAGDDPPDGTLSTSSTVAGGGGGGPPLGGVDLSVPAALLGDALPTVETLVCDAASGQLLLVGPYSSSQPALRAPDLAMALWLVFGPRPQDAQFSLDAADPHNLRGPWLKAVYFPEAMRGTEFGETLFTADFTMKQLALGVRVDANGAIESRPPIAPGFLSVPDLMQRVRDRRKQSDERWARYWLIVKDLVLQRAGGNFAIETVRMGAQARWQHADVNARSGLADIATPRNAVETRWATQLTDRYQELALPEFVRLAELVKTMALLKCLRERGVRIDLEWAERALACHTTAGTERVPALSVTWKTETRKAFDDARGRGVETTIHTLNLFGGVDLTVTPRFSWRSGGLDRTVAAVKDAIANHGPRRVFALDVGGRELYAKVLPINSAGRALWCQLC